MAKHLRKDSDVPDKKGHLEEELKREVIDGEDIQYDMHQCLCNYAYCQRGHMNLLRCLRPDT